MLKVDEALEIDCDICQKRYGFVSLLPGNHFVMELFYDLNSPFISTFNKLQSIIWEKYKHQIEEEGFFKILHKLNIITEILKEFSEAKTGK